jgi:hypothetical protein
MKNIEKLIAYNLSFKWLSIDDLEHIARLQQQARFSFLSLLP